MGLSNATDPLAANEKISVSTFSEAEIPPAEILM